MVPSPFDGTPANAGAAARNTTARKRRRIQSSGKSAGVHDTGRIAGAKFPDRDVGQRALWGALCVRSWNSGVVRSDFKSSSSRACPARSP